MIEACALSLSPTIILGVGLFKSLGRVWVCTTTLLFRRYQPIHIAIDLDNCGSSMKRTCFGLMDVTIAFLPHLRCSTSNPTLVVVGSRSAWKTDLSVCAAATHGSTYSDILFRKLVNPLTVFP